MTILNFKKFYEAETNRDVISLFSGAMGLDIGLEKAGLNIKLCQEIDKNCVSTIEANGHSVIAGDIRSADAEVMLNKIGLRRGEPFLVCGGPPCQPFSTAGKRQGINDPRGSLFMEFKRLVESIMPRFFVMENVKGLLSTPLQEESNISNYNELTVFDVVKEQMESIGYKVIYGLLDAVNYGVPQFRERLVIIGSRDNENIYLPMPTHFQLHQDKHYRWQTLRDAISDLETNPGLCVRFSEDRIRYLDLVPEGGNWRDLPGDLKEEAMGGAYLSGGGKVGFFRRLSYDQPSPTLLTSPVQKASMLCHPKQSRPLSIREYARIQQFPDDWQFIGSLNDIYKQIGNAVPVGLSKAIGNVLISVANGSSIINTKRTRGTAVHYKIQTALQTGNTVKEDIYDWNENCK